MNVLFLIYLGLLCSILPLYMKTGYYELGEAKAICYLTLSIPFVVMVVVNYVIKRKKILGEKGSTEKTSLPQLFLYGTIYSHILSLLFSVDIKTAFLGYEGWRNGFLSAIVVLVIAIYVSREKKLKYKLIFVIALFLVPFFEFILSIINRFGIYPFVIKGQNASFVATLGNINWFSGFLSIWVPLGLALMYCLKRFSGWWWISFVYALTGILALLLQGSDGGILILAACFLFMLWISLDSWESFKSFLLVLMVMGFGMTIVDIVIGIFDAYSYDSNILISICQSHAGIIILAAAFFLYRIVRLLEEIKVVFIEKVLRRIYLVALAVIAIVAVALLAMNFSDSFGNGRGIIWRICADMYVNLPPWQKVVGIGQDCLYPFAMKDAFWNDSFRNIFGTDILTNAHCEILTILLERGLIGAICYVGLFVSILYELVRAKEKEPIAVIYGLPIISYFLYNQVSFSQVTSMPYCMILVGLSIGLISRPKEKTKTDDLLIKGRNSN